MDNSRGLPPRARLALLEFAAGRTLSTLLTFLPARVPQRERSARRHLIPVVAVFLAALALWLPSVPRTIGFGVAALLVMIAGVSEFLRSRCGEGGLQRAVGRLALESKDGVVLLRVDATSAAPAHYEWYPLEAIRDFEITLQGDPPVSRVELTFNIPDPPPAPAPSEREPSLPAQYGAGLRHAGAPRVRPVRARRLSALLARLSSGIQTISERLTAVTLNGEHAQATAQKLAARPAGPSPSPDSKVQAAESLSGGAPRVVACVMDLGLAFDRSSVEHTVESLRYVFARDERTREALAECGASVDAGPGAASEHAPGPAAATGPLAGHDS